MRTPHTSPINPTLNNYHYLLSLCLGLSEFSSFPSSKWVEPHIIKTFHKPSFKDTWADSMKTIKILRFQFWETL